MSFKTMFRKLLPGYTDKRVQEINNQSLKKIKESGQVAKRHADLLKKDGIAYRIVIATGGDRHD